MAIADNLPTVDPKEAAKEAGLRYVSDVAAGIRRVNKGKHFAYVHPDGSAVTDDATIERIKKLVIPPAWMDVWICPSPRGHLQATGRDAKSRKQYRYHSEWRVIRDRTKYDKLLEFGSHLPKIRRKVEEDLKQKGLAKEKVLAAVVRILDLTHIRIGNEEYANENKSYGLTTLRNKHVDIDGSSVRFTFKGKSGQKQDIHFKDPRIARIVQKCEELPGHELFGYLDDHGRAVDITSEDVNAYLKEMTGEDITAKDFRTWGGTIQAAMCLYHNGECDTELAAKQRIVSAVKEVAGALGNRPATCKKYYIDPRIFSSYQKRHLCGYLAKELTKSTKDSQSTLHPMERAILKLLEEKID